MYNTLIVAIPRKIYFAEIKTAEYIECRYHVSGKPFKCELQLGGLHIPVKNFDEAREIWLAVYNAAKRGDKYFNFYDYCKAKQRSDLF